MLATACIDVGNQNAQDSVTESPYKTPMKTKNIVYAVIRQYFISKYTGSTFNSFRSTHVKHSIWEFITNTRWVMIFGAHLACVNSISKTLFSCVDSACNCQVQGLEKDTKFKILKSELLHEARDYA